MLSDICSQHWSMARCFRSWAGAACLWWERCRHSSSFISGRMSEESPAWLKGQLSQNLRRQWAKASRAYWMQLSISCGSHVRIQFVQPWDAGSLSHLSGEEPFLLAAAGQNRIGDCESGSAAGRNCVWEPFRKNRPTPRDCHRRTAGDSYDSAVGLFAQPPMLALGGFLMQFMVQGAWGVIPAHLNELSPAAVRGTFPGLAYQLGNLLASWNAVIQARLVEKRYAGSFPPVLAGTVLLVAVSSRDGNCERTRAERRRPLQHESMKIIDILRVRAQIGYCRVWHKGVIVRSRFLWYFLGKFHAFVDSNHKVQMAVVFCANACI